MCGTFEISTSTKKVCHITVLNARPGTLLTINARQKLIGSCVLRNSLIGKLLLVRLQGISCKENTLLTLSSVTDSIKIYCGIRISRSSLCRWHHLSMILKNSHEKVSIQGVLVAGLRRSNSQIVQQCNRILMSIFSTFIANNLIGTSTLYELFSGCFAEGCSWF